MNNLKNIKYNTILWYFIIFSIIGLIFETLYCYITTGIIESRKGLLLGPFCPIYGLCAVVIILSFNNSPKSIKELFIKGLIYGSILEYTISYILEAIYGIRFWNYSYLKINLNGRISLLYAVYWGILTVILTKYISPNIDKIIKKIPNKKIINIIITIFLIIDTLCTIWAIQVYKNRVINNKKIEIKNLKEYIEETFFSNKIMNATFPNLRIKDENGEEKFIREYLE